MHVRKKSSPIGRSKGLPDVQNSALQRGVSHVRPARGQAAHDDRVYSRRVASACLVGQHLLAARLGPPSC